MGTLVLIAAFLLAASATPVEILSGDSSDDHQDQHWESSVPEHTSVYDAVSAGTQGHSPDTHSGGTSENDENDNSLSPSSSEDAAGRSTEEHPSGAVTDHSSDNDTNDGPSSPLPTQDDFPTSNEPQSELPPSTADSKPPADDDPRDCNITDGEDHVYSSCQFLCSGDEMEVARENATCYLNQTEATAAPFGVRTRMESNETGICRDGYCVPQPRAYPTSIPTTEPSTSFSSTETSMSTSTTEISTSTSTTPATINDSRDTTTLERISMA